MPFLLLIIPIIMAHYENLINNTEDIVMAISHMVVGLCSVTILPLASTYVCQRRAAMTSSSSAHLALPTERHTLGLGRGRCWVFLLASRLSEFCTCHPVGLGTKCQLASEMAHQTLVLLGNTGEETQENNYLCLCVTPSQTKYTDSNEGRSLGLILLNKNTSAHAPTCT